MIKQVVMWLIIVFSMQVSYVWGSNAYDRINEIIETMDTGNIPKDLIKAIAWVESRWTQMYQDGYTFRNHNTNGSTDWGIMQINDFYISTTWDFDRLKSDAAYNIKIGVLILRGKLRDAERVKDIHNLEDVSVRDVGITMYNGFTPRTTWRYLELVNNALTRKPWLSKLSKKVVYFGNTSYNNEHVYVVYDDVHTTNVLQSNKIALVGNGFINSVEIESSSVNMFFNNSISLVLFGYFVGLLWSIFIILRSKFKLRRWFL